ncbi:MAG: inositol monophosphatase family protein, partial [Methylococcales bacterium]|nr:inositol monophosphatase family protein [Methylococcales bacterium]
GIRKSGAAALELAYVAANRLDGFVGSDLKPWDIAAGALLIQEAGGMVGDFSGGESYLQSGQIVAGPLKVFKSAVQIFHAAI